MENIYENNYILWLHNFKNLGEARSHYIFCAPPLFLLCCFFKIECVSRIVTGATDIRRRQESLIFLCFYDFS